MSWFLLFFVALASLKLVGALVISWKWILFPPLVVLVPWILRGLILIFVFGYATRQEKNAHPHD